MIVNNFIQYYNGAESVKDAMSFFTKKKTDLINALEKKAVAGEVKLLSTETQQVSLELQALEREMEHIIKEAIAQPSHNITDSSLIDMAQNMSGYLYQKTMDISNKIKQQNQYNIAYDTFQSLIYQLLYEKHPGIIIDIDTYKKLLQSINFTNKRKMYKEIGNALGNLGEIAGLSIGYDISQKLLNSFQMKIPDLNIEIRNTGNQKNISKETITTDNLIVIKQGQQVIFTINLSNKLNTAYAGISSKSSKKAIKLATRSLGNFIFEDGNIDYAPHIYNTISFHWEDYYRKDYLTKKHSADMRRAIGGQMLLDHINGTNKQVAGSNISFQDRIHLYSYGNKIFAEDELLGALLRKRGAEKFNLAQINLNSRYSWVPSGAFSRSKIQDIYDAQNRINKFTATYSQTLQFV